jgi:phospholipase/carboxylesterase
LFELIVLKRDRDLCGRHTENHTTTPPACLKREASSGGAGVLKPKAMGDLRDRSFRAPLDCHYLLLAPDAVDPQTPLVLTLHGFGADPEAMLSLTARLFERQPVIAALQGPNQFFRGPDTREVGYGWITSRRPAESIRLHHEMLLHVADEAGGEFGIPRERRLLVGFSQSVGLNYRFAATHPDAVRGVIGICGGLPGDWDDGAYRAAAAAVLHIARRGDEYYPPSVTAHYPERLRRRAADVEFHLIDGGHQMPSSGSRIVEPWLRRILW